MIPLEPIHYFDLAVFFVLGVVFGSFGNVLILRFPTGKTIQGRSECMHCKHQLSAKDLVPILSYLFLMGNCRYCKKHISRQYPIVEFVSGLLFVVAFSFMEYGLLARLVLALCLWLLFVIAVIDSRIQGIPDALNIPLLILAAVFSGLAGTFDWIAVAIAVGFLGTQWLVSHGKWVGSGDIILIAGIGFLVGRWQSMIVCFFASYILGAIIASIMIGSGMKKRTDALAFAPFLVTGTIVALLWGDLLLSGVYGI